MTVSAARVLRTIANEEQTDAELLGRFIDRRDEVAFALLVRRHGAMVYGVCRRLLPNDQDAEDAFQATFLVLAEKARTVFPREAAGNWLYGVARRAALLARRGIARRRERMGTVPERPASPSDELRAVLDEELSRLPDPYRTVVVLCDLEGRTRREAAAILGWPEGTVAGRLVRAREMLAKRLAPSVSIAALLAGTASARVPEVLSAAVPPAVAALTREMLGAMVRGKLMKTAVVVLLLGCCGFGMVAAQKPGSAPPAAAVDGGLPVNPAKADEVAWGEEVDGLQVGITRVARAYRHGERMKPEVKLRNVGKAEVQISYGLHRDHAPEVTAADGARVSVYMPLPLGIKVKLVVRVIKPGETITLYNPELAVESEDRARVLGEMRVEAPTICAGPGKYRIAYGRVVQSHPKLATGAAEFEVTDAKAARKTAIYLPTHDGFRELKGKEMEAYETTNAWLAERLKEAQSVKAGSTYADLSKHFRADGGLTPVGKGRYVMILCPYIKIDVEFEAAKGDTLPPTAKVTKVSRPYFESGFLD